MQILFVVIGKTSESYLREGISKYISRIKHYISFDYLELPALKNTRNIDPIEQKKKEGEIILKNFQKTDFVVLLDEHGRQMNSLELAQFIENKTIASCKRIVFFVGGPFGFSDELKSRANHLISLSRMTFSHQMVRLIFCEQLYRAFSIINNEPYHNI